MADTANYELAVVYHPDLEIDLDKAEKKVEKLVSDAGGKITETDNWGKRKLAYAIGKHEHGVYVFYSVEMPGEGVSSLNDALNITDEVIRFLISKPDLKKIAKAQEMKDKRDKRMADNAESSDDSDDDEDEE